MANSLADKYIELFSENERAKLALLACSAALRLDDVIARKAIELVARSNGSTGKLLHQVKSLSCVWKQWDGSWFIAENVRRDLQRRLGEVADEALITELRETLAVYADNRIETLPPDGQFSVYQAEQARFEAAIQRTLIPGETKTGAPQLIEMYESMSNSSKHATEEAVEYLAPDLEHHLGELPAEVLFLRGMAARARNDRKSREDQIKYFTKVWEIGGFGYAFGFATHLLGLLIKGRDPERAESAFLDSMRFYSAKEHRAHVLHSLGNLLSKDKRRWDEAEDAYRGSFDLREDDDDEGRGQVLHSLGHLYAQDKNRFDKALEVYKQSLDLRRSSADKAQVLHSIGKLLSHDKYKGRWQEAKEAFAKSLELDPHPAGKAQVLTSWADLLLKSYDPRDYELAARLAHEALKLDGRNLSTKGMCYRILASYYEKLGDLPSAIKALEDVRETNQKLGNKEHERRTLAKIESLRRRLPSS